MSIFLFMSLYLGPYLCLCNFLSLLTMQLLMLQVLERASRAMEASQHFEHAASVRLNSMDRGSARQLNSLDMAINQVLQGMGHSSPSIAKEPTKVSPVKGSPSRSQFAMEAVAATCYQQGWCLRV